MNDSSSLSFVKKVLIVFTIASLIALLILFIGFSIQVLLTIFAGILLGVIFRALRDFVHSITGLPEGGSLTIVVIIFSGLIIGLGFLIGPELYKQAEDMYQKAPQEWEQVKKELYKYQWGKEIVQENPHPRDMVENSNKNNNEDHDMTKGVLALFSVTFSAVAGSVLMVVIAIYIAAEPELYTRGLLRLFPINRRRRVLAIMNEISRTVQWWLIGQMVSMAILGVITTLGLKLLGVPFALILGLFTAIMTFIPNIGPIIAGLPTVFIASTVGIDTAIYTLIFYVVLQCIEGYFITPMIHHKAISVPPVLIISVQFLLYYLIGFIGVLIAMPLIACCMVIIRMVYIEDILGDSMDEDISYDLSGENINLRNRKIF